MTGKTKTLLMALALVVAPVSAWAETNLPTIKVAPTPNYQVAADAILDVFTFRYSDEKGVVDYPEVFNALGALAGYACQMAVRESFIKTGMLDEQHAFYVYPTADGHKFYLSKLVDAQLVGSDKVTTSVLSLVDSAVQEAGGKYLPNAKAISDYNFKTMGTDDFGIAPITKKYNGVETPIGILHRNWQPMRQILEKNKVDPKFWGWTFALAARQVIMKSPLKFDPSTAAEIVMESAVAMSTVDPAALSYDKH